MCRIIPAILSIVAPYHVAVVCVENKTMPTPPTEMFGEENLENTLYELHQKSKTAFHELKISVKEAKSNKRPGRQQSVVYQMRANHDQELNLALAASGLHITEKWPLGASPDGLVSCDSSGKGLCESTYPYKYKDVMLVAALADSSSCPNYDDNGVDFCLDTVHAYYYQEQSPLFITGVEYCDFVVWTTKDLFVQKCCLALTFGTECCQRQYPSKIKVFSQRC